MLIFRYNWHNIINLFLLTQPSHAFTDSWLSSSLHLLCICVSMLWWLTSLPRSGGHYSSYRCSYSFSFLLSRLSRLVMGALSHLGFSSFLLHNYVNLSMWLFNTEIWLHVVDIFLYFLSFPRTRASPSSLHQCFFLLCTWLCTSLSLP